MVALGWWDGFEYVVLLLRDGEGVEVHVLLEVREHASADGFGDVVVAFVGRAGEGGAAAIDPELLEGPGFVWERGFPEAAAAFGFLPAGDEFAGGEGGVFAGPGDLGVFFAESEGFGKGVGAGCYDDACWLGGCASGVACGLRGGDGAGGGELDVCGGDERGCREKEGEGAEELGGFCAPRAEKGKSAASSGIKYEWRMPNDGACGLAAEGRSGSGGKVFNHGTHRRHGRQSG